MKKHVTIETHYHSNLYTSLFFPLQEQILKDLMVPIPNGTNDMPMKHSPGGAASVMQSVTSGMDPFLGQATQPNHALQEAHARQNSADSGLGESWSSGGNVSLARWIWTIVYHIQ